MKTVGELRLWLAGLDDSVRIELLIETEDCQYQYPMNDVALVTRKGIEQKYVVIMHEMFDRKVKTVKSV